SRWPHRQGRDRLPLRRAHPGWRRAVADHPRSGGSGALRAPIAARRRLHCRRRARAATTAGVVSVSSQLDERPPAGLGPARSSLLTYALRLARRELRGGVAGFRIFLACLVLGVTAVAGIGSLTAAVVAGIHADARILLGGDVSLR